MSENRSQFVIYQTEDGQTRLDVRFEDETVWLSQAMMAELFQTSSDNVSLHLKNIYGEGELEEAATTEDFSVVRREGNRDIRRNLRHYNLDAIISVGYRVKSHTATRFRQNRSVDALSLIHPTYGSVATVGVQPSGCAVWHSRHKP
jgi:hypothetical protein